jgi:hypothetical protein
MDSPVCWNYDRDCTVTRIQNKKKNMILLKTSGLPIFFLLELAYLCGLFEKLNALNLFLQGRNTHILKLAENISAFRKI